MLSGRLERELLGMQTSDGKPASMLIDKRLPTVDDVEGYARALEEMDAWLPTLEAAVAPGDLVILTADHGCDPTTPSTDHSREYVPLLVRGGRAVDLGVRSTLSDIGQTVAENFGTRIGKGTSFLRELL